MDKCAPLALKPLGDGIIDFKRIFKHAKKKSCVFQFGGAELENTTYFVHAVLSPDKLDQLVRS